MFKVSQIHSKQNISSYAKAINTGLRVVGDISPKALEGGIKIADIKKAVQKYLPKVDVQHISKSTGMNSLKSALGAFDMSFQQMKNGKFKVKSCIYVDELTELNIEEKSLQFFPIIGHEVTHASLENTTKRFENFLNKYNSVYPQDIFIMLSEFWLNFEDNVQKKVFIPNFKKLTEFNVKSSSDKALFNLLKVKDFGEFNTKMKDAIVETSKPAIFQPDDLKIIWEMFKGQSIDEMVAYDTTERIASSLLEVPKSIYSYYSKFYENMAKSFHV